MKWRRPVQEICLQTSYYIIILLYQSVWRSIPLAERRSRPGIVPSAPAV